MDCAIRDEFWTMAHRTDKYFKNASEHDEIRTRTPIDPPNAENNRLPIERMQKSLIELVVDTIATTASHANNLES